MKGFVFGILLTALFLLTSCSGGTPRIDSSTPQTFKNSIKEVGASLPLEERQKFAGLIVLYGAGTSINDSLSGKASGKMETLRKNLHGKTGTEVIAFIQDEIKKKKSKAAAKSQQ